MAHVTSKPQPGRSDWKLDIFESDDGMEPYIAFVESLDPYRLAVIDTAIDVILRRQGNDVCGHEWGKALGKGLYEFRVRRSLTAICNEAGIPVPAGAPTGGQVTLRVFFTVHGDRIVLLLGGYNKQADPSEKRQQREIARARTLLKQHEERMKRLKKQGHQ